MAMGSIKALARAIEDEMVAFYGLKPVARVESHIFLSDHSMSNLNGPSPLAETMFSANGDEFLISIRISEELKKMFEREVNPLQTLSHRNLNFFAILTEEISHFHYLIENLLNGTETTQLELEVQAEFDKLLVAALMLKMQTGQPHLRALARLMFDHGRSYRDSKLYDKSEGLVASWWWAQINAYGENLWDYSEVRSCLRRIRNERGQRKLQSISDRPLLLRTSA